jgi:hypothetical protein
MREIQPSSASALATLRQRPAFIDGSVTGRVTTPQGGWRIALLIADEPSSGADPMQQAPRSEGAVLSSMVTATDLGGDGSFTITGLRDGYYQLALLPPAGTGVPQLAQMTVKGDPGVFALLAPLKAKNVGVIALTY